MKTCVEEFKEHLPLIASLFNPGLRDRHWEKMSAIVEQDLKPSESSNLQQYIEMNLEPYLEQFEAISEGASREYSLEKAIEKMMLEWRDVSFIVQDSILGGRISIRRRDQLRSHDACIPVLSYVPVDGVCPDSLP